MAYQNGTYSSMHNLLDTVKGFLLNNGWTINLWANDVSEIWSRAEFDYSGGKRLHVQKTAVDGTVMYFNFRSVTRGVVFKNYGSQTSLVNGRLYNEQRGIGINGSTGYDGGQTWSEQPGFPKTTGGLSVGGLITEIPASGSNNYWIFQNGDIVTLIVEIDTGVYGWISFGCLQKSGNWTGGQFYTASVSNYNTSYVYWSLSFGTRQVGRSIYFAKVYSTDGSGAVYLTLDTVAAWRFAHSPGNDNHVYKDKINFGAQGPYAGLTDYQSLHFSAFANTRTPNAFNGLTVMIPLYVFVKNANNRWSFLGTPESLRAVSLSNYSPADEITYEGDIWKLFPAHRKEESGTTNLNGNVGFALKKIT